MTSVKESRWRTGGWTRTHLLVNGEPVCKKKPWGMASTEKSAVDCRRCVKTYRFRDSQGESRAAEK